MTSEASRDGVPWLWTLPAVAVIALTVVVGVARYPGLPNRIPVHFDVHGTVDRTASTTLVRALFPIVIQLVLTAVLVGAAALTMRAPRGEAHDRQLVAAALLLLAGCLDLTLFLVATQIWRAGSAISPGVAALAVAGVLAGVALVIAAAVRVTVTAGRGPQPADADHYRGIFYVNRKDPAVFVPKRFGAGWTLNFGRPVSWIVPGLIVALVVAGVVAGSLSG